jgi:hypothetical protein
MSIDRNTAYRSAISVLRTRQTFYDSIFIANVATQTATADALGKNEITAWTNKNINLTNVYLYYTALGYNVYFPDFANMHAGKWPGTYNQPSDLFGWLWVDYWENKINLFGLQNPCRITLSWGPNQPPPQPEPEAGEVQSF